VWVDTSRNQLRARAQGSGGAPREESADLPDNYAHDAWHSLVVEVRNGRLYAELSHARLFDPLATLEMDLPGNADQARRGGAIAKGGNGEVDNLSVFTAHTPVTNVIQPAFPDEVAFEDDFVTPYDAPESGWTFTDDTRGNPNPTVVPLAPGAAIHEKRPNAGQLVWPIEDTDLNVEGNNSGLLLRNPPSQDGTWAVETLVTIDNRRLGADGQPLADQCCLNYQQGGLVVIANGDLFTRLATVSIWNTRQNEFGIQIPNGDTPGNPNDVYNAGTIAGPPGATPTGTSTYLRIVHTLDENNGEHELRAWTRRNEAGSHWVEAGVWTLPAAAELKVGLVSQGRQGPEADRRTSRFDYFRAYTG
jgi:hypothetical protein